MLALSGAITRYEGEHAASQSRSPTLDLSDDAIRKTLVPHLEAILRSSMQSLVGDVERSTREVANEQSASVAAKVMPKVALTERAVEAIETMMAATTGLPPSVSRSR